MRLPLRNTLGSSPVSAEPTASDLVTEFLSLKDWLAAEAKRFSEHCAPYRTRQEEIRNIFLAKFNAEKIDNQKTEAGTAYKSTSMAPKVIEREPFLDWVLDKWDERGAMLMIGAPQMDSFKEYLQENNDALPPGTSVSYTTTINIRRS